MKDRIYLDHAATSWPKPSAVVDRTVRSLTELTANAGRSGHRASLGTARMVFDLRSSLADLLHVQDSANIVFVRGCTEGLNLVLRGWLNSGDLVLVSPMEHNAVMRPLTSLADRIGLQIGVLPADPWGRVDVRAARNVAGSSPPNLLAVQHASNVNGVVHDIAGLREVFPDTPILVDAAQTAGVLPLPVDRWNVDFLTASLHKGLLGPTGIGFCYIAPHREIQPLIEGGTGSRSEAVSQPSFRPDCYESGTLNLHGIAGGLGALEGLETRGLLGDHKRQLTTQLIHGLRGIQRVCVWSPADGTALCVSFTVENLDMDEVARRMEREFGVFCRPGLHCAPAAHRHLGTLPQGTIRLSPGWGNTEQDIDLTLRGIETIVQKV